MADIVHFGFGMNTVRTLLRDGEVWFVGKDVAEVLGYSRSADAIRTHCKGVDEMETPSQGGVQTVKIIPERDLYRLIFRSRLPEAEKFEDWVVSEVLPALRKQGTYTIPQEEVATKFSPNLPEAALRLKSNVRAQVLNCALQAAKMDDETSKRIDAYFAKYAAMVGTTTQQPLPEAVNEHSAVEDLVLKWMGEKNLKPAKEFFKKNRIQSTHLYSKFRMWCYSHDLYEVPSQHLWGREVKKYLPSKESGNIYYFIEGLSKEDQRP